MSHLITLETIGGPIMSTRLNLRVLIVLLAVLPLVNALTVALGAEKASVTVVNRTGRFIHVFVDGEQFLYVPSDRSIIHTGEPKSTVLVEAFYSPGQDVAGSLTDTVSVPYRAAREACTCAEGQTWGDCIYTPPAGGSARLEIFPEDMEDPQ